MVHQTNIPVDGQVRKGPWAQASYAGLAEHMAAAKMDPGTAPAGVGRGANHLAQVTYGYTYCQIAARLHMCQTDLTCFHLDPQRSLGKGLKSPRVRWELA